MNLPATLPILRRRSPLPLVVKWTRYGRWTPDGMHVLNNAGGVIYSHPLARPFKVRF